MADGRAQFLKSNTPPARVRAMATIAGGEILD
jgi:hypothetical protein